MKILRDFTMPRSTSLTFTSLVFLAGCMSPAIVKQADMAVSAAAMSFRSQPDRARVYFVNGKISGNLFGISHRYPKDIFVNGKLIGSMNPENVMVTSMRPGEYRFAWNVRSTDIIDKKTESVDALIRIESGDIVVLVSEYDPGGAAMFGLIGAMMSSPKARFQLGTPADVGDKTVVSPQSCPRAFCLSSK